MTVSDNPRPNPGQDSALSTDSPSWGATKAFGLTMILLGAIGLFFSALIMVDKIALMQDSNFVPACTINSLVSCTDVMRSPQAAAFGFPNPIIGIAAFPIIITIGMAALGGTRFRPWFWYGLLTGLTLAVAFVHWLAFEAVFTIGALCPYCMVVWVVTMALFMMVLVHVVREPRRAHSDEVAHSFSLPLLVLLAWYAGFAAIIAVQMFL